jgi:hypothetical protein
MGSRVAGFWGGFVSSVRKGDWEIGRRHDGFGGVRGSRRKARWVVIRRGIFVVVLFCCGVEGWMGRWRR